MTFTQSQNDKFDAENLKDSKEIVSSNTNYKLKIFNNGMNLLAHILIGTVVGTAILFCFRAGTMDATRIHIILCVLGYQLLMSQAILSLSPHNSWSSSLKLVHKRRAHWVLQILGSGLAIAGSIIKILDKTVHWNTLHGQFALVALVFTGVSFINGLTSLYAYELRRILPTTLSKITHICFGTVAFVAASTCLCYGFDKMFFRNWATPQLSATLIGFTAALTFIIVVTPVFNFADKTLRVFKR
ncbi:uncharacterized protein LOC106135752 [Amyelois transitella]|uniref:uncharacterized protein LOC106135752 n=1 Tax=Amyelois transitella TaxID=680683 RepID=UPI00067BB7B8|nr:uncharacterized protein LOC106135752 [Amyelois transitella]